MKTRMARSILAVASVVFAASRAVATPVEWPVAAGGNGNWFEVVVAPGPISWDDARAEAAARIFNGWHGSLATAPTANKDLFIRELAAATPGAFTDIGGIQSGPWIAGFQPAGSPEPAGGWTWISGETWNYSNWFPGEPNQGGGSDENSIHLITDSLPIDPMAVGWNDLSSGPNPYYEVNAYTVEYTVPEPSSAALICFAGLGAAYRRRRAA